MNKIASTLIIAFLSLAVSTLRADKVRANDLSVGATANVNAQNKTIVADSSVTKLVNMLTSPELDWRERFGAEQKLADVDSELVLLALIPELSRNDPFTGWGIYNGSDSAQGDSKGPVKWQIFYALHRLWSAHVTKLFGDDNAAPPASIGQRLIEHLAFAPSKGWILRELGGAPHSHIFWFAEAEKPVVALFRDPKTKEEFRAAAMECLLKRTNQKYYGEIKAAIFSYPQVDEKQLFLKADRLQMLIEYNRVKRFKNPTPPAIDKELVRYAFSTLRLLENFSAGRSSHFARSLGDYIGQDFQPDEHNAKYGGETFHNALYHTDTTANALNWWKKHQNSYSLKRAKSN